MSRLLSYQGVDPAWEERERSAFAKHSNRPGATVGQFLLGRFLEEDIHVSCKPMLPSDVVQLNGKVLKGVCILQIVDVVNIGANFEHRTENSKGPSRTLKLCLTDGYQVISGFEYQWLPQLSVNTPRGTKVAIQNVAVRHGMLLLTPSTCQLVGSSGEPVEADKRKTKGATKDPTAGVYSAALLTTGSIGGPAIKPSGGTPQKGSMDRSVRTHVSTTVEEISEVHTLQRTVTPTAVQEITSTTITANASATRQTITTAEQQQFVSPPVFIDLSSQGEDYASDTTDPHVEHLFYSPNTPRVRPSASRKRPHPDSSKVQIQNAGSPGRRQEVVDVTFSPPSSAESRDLSAPSFSLLNQQDHSLPPDIVDLSLPFQYLQSRRSELYASSASVGSVVTIRAFVKSVAGFQFNTGAYVLRVLIEDCTECKEVAVDPSLVEQLMGVTCSEFMTSMQKTPKVAHGWAAKMQVTLMTMQGIMRLRREPNNKLTLLSCSLYSKDDVRALLQRARHLQSDT